MDQQINTKSAKCESKITECSVCKFKKSFELPDEIFEAYRTGNLVIFAGAGVSTETRGVYPHSFYEEIKMKLSISSEKEIGFSKLMTAFCSDPNSRKDLLKAIKGRIDYVKSFPELYNFATEFHRELSTIPHLDEIFTTNWDDFFEIECQATPIVTGEDFAVLQDIPGRKVFKLNGSIYNFGSIVATEAEYVSCYRRLSTGIIGAKLKMLLLSKTVVFFGFSFDDEDFQRLYHLLEKDVAGLIPKIYVVTVDEDTKEKFSSLKIKATPIITSAGFFIHKFKEKLVENKLMVTDERYDGLYKALDKLRLHDAKVSKIVLSQHPDALYTLAYQDGMYHAFARLLSTKESGQNSCPTHMMKILDSYDDLVKKRLHEHDYLDVAYFIGYQSGMLYFLLDEKNRRDTPMYFIIGCQHDLKTYDEYLDAEKEAPNLHKSAYKQAEKFTEMFADNLVYHYTPFS